MNGLIISSAIALMLVANATASCFVCPQTVLNDQSTKFCARNSNGEFDVTQSQFSNWNCNHPFNKFTIVSQGACTDGQDTRTDCGPDPCVGNTGRAICASLGASTAVFDNTCELNFFNCRNPTTQYVVNLQSAQVCTTLGL